MNRSGSLFLSVILLAALAGSSSANRGQAQVAQPDAPPARIGTAFTYQGRLEDGDQPASGSNDLRFQLYTAGSGGSQVGSTLEKDNVAVIGGNFTVLLDFGAVFDGHELWLEVSVRPGASTGGYTVLTPRQVLSAAPYAVFSLRAPWSGLTGTPRNDHDHLGQTWTGSNNSLRIEGSFDDEGNHAALILANENGDFGLSVETADVGVNVASASNIGMYLRETQVGVRVENADTAGIEMFTVGSPSDLIPDPDERNNGIEINGAEGNGLYVGRADAYGVYVRSAHLDGFFVNSAYRNGVNVTSASQDGVRVETAGDDGVYAHTASASNYGFHTPDRIKGSNMTASSFSLVAQVTGSARLSPGDLVAAAGLGPSLPGSSEPVPQVLLAGGASSGVIGVVEKRMELTPPPQREGENEEPAQELLMSEGPAATGDYVAIRVLGLAQVKLDASAGEIQPGMRLTAASLPGLARALQTTEVNGILVAESASTIGVALSAPDENGLVWVLLNPQ